MRRRILCSLLVVWACARAPEAPAGPTSTEPAAVELDPGPSDSPPPPVAEPAPTAASTTSAPHPDGAHAEPDKPKVSAAPAPACPEAQDSGPWVGCKAYELTGEPPCERLCSRPAPKPATKCCPSPRIDAVLDASGTVLLTQPVCGHMSHRAYRSCTRNGKDFFGTAIVQRWSDAPNEVVYVAPGCMEAYNRALMHGYIKGSPPYWLGCHHRRFGWKDGLLTDTTR